MKLLQDFIIIGVRLMRWYHLRNLTLIIDRCLSFPIRLTSWFIRGNIHLWCLIRLNWKPLARKLSLSKSRILDFSKWLKVPLNRGKSTLLSTNICLRRIRILRLSIWWHDHLRRRRNWLKISIHVHLRLRNIRWYIWLLVFLLKYILMILDSQVAFGVYTTLQTFIPSPYHHDEEF